MTVENFEGYGAPDITIVGEVGDLYTDLDTGKVYECSMVYRYAASQSLGGVTHEYVWTEKTENSGGVSSWNDLADKPFGDIPVETLVVDETQWGTMETITPTFVGSIGFKDTARAYCYGDFGEAIIDTVWDYDILEGMYNEGVFTDDSLGIKFVVDRRESEVRNIGETIVNSFKVVELTEETVQLDPKFLPYSASTEDIEAGVTPLETGTFYFVYE